MAPLRDFSDRYGFEDPLSDQFHVSGTEPEPAPAPKRAKTKGEREAARVARRRSEASTQAASTVRRRRWEGTSEGQARMRDIQDLVTEQHNRLARDYPHLGLRQIERTSQTPAQIYHSLGVTSSGHGHGEQQLPGMENPHAAPTPPRWEDLSDAQRAETERRLRVHAGTSVEQMSRDFGAQLDQAVWRAGQAGHVRASTGEPVPFTKHFYDSHPEDTPEPLDRPHRMLRESREHLRSRGIEIDPGVHLAVVSHVSPNVKFTQGERGNRTSPNIEAAESVIEQHASGVAPYNVTSGKNRRGINNQSRPANARRAAVMLEHVAQGGSIGTSRNLPSESNPRGSSQWGPKTGPFVNSFDASQPDFFVADVHSGGGGMLPHLGTDKPVYNAPEHPTARRRMTAREMQVAGMKILREKSGREKGMERGGIAVPGTEGKKVTYHSAADYAARQAIARRGLGTSVRQPQAMQWGEEQIQRKEAMPRLDLPTHEDAYPSPSRNINPNQMRLL